jgi:signal transduction histidine kinase
MGAVLENATTLATAATVSNLERVSLCEVSNRVWRGFSTVETSPTVTEDFSVERDSSLIEQLLENLFRNALTHAGPDASVTVGVLDDERGFYVADDGPGIPAADTARVFEPAYTTEGGGRASVLRS